MRQDTLFHSSANVVMEKIGADKFYVKVLGELKKIITYLNSLACLC
jgi:hypothetical protein